MRSEQTSSNGLTWIALQEPTADELAALARDANLEPIDAEFVIHNHHRPEVAVRENYFIILIEVASFDRNDRVTTGAPLYFVVQEQKLWTVCHQPVVVLEKIFDEFTDSEAKRDDYFADGAAALALHLASEMYASAFNKLSRLAKHINIAEDAVFHGNERKMVEEVSILMRDVMDFRSIVRPQIGLFAEAPNHPLLPPEFQSHWLRLNHQVAKLWEYLESLFESSKELRDTNNSLVQHKENELLRLLTYYTTISIPIWILLGPLDPFSGDTSLPLKIFFWAILAGLAVGLIIIFTYFRRKRVL